MSRCRLWAHCPGTCVLRMNSWVSAHGPCQSPMQSDRATPSPHPPTSLRTILFPLYTPADLPDLPLRLPWGSIASCQTIIAAFALSPFSFNALNLLRSLNDASSSHNNNGNRITTNNSPWVLVGAQSHCRSMLSTLDACDTSTLNAWIHPL